MRRHCQARTAVDTARQERKLTTQMRDLEKEMWMTSFSYSWRKIEAVDLDGDQVICGLTSHK